MSTLQLWRRLLAAVKSSAGISKIVLTINGISLSTRLNSKIKNGANCLQLAPFGFVPHKGQITKHFMEDLSRLAYWK
ncbi:hypothetical protein [Flavobacterium sp. LHD-85]|uniref:hypothetical protein n=1 Tax=Flavobacterium sp. LHD-85 TaxID=3071410 RepID=UPI0027E196A9|nr:hypothetical protein [Flavobacterium sp. LHD-85]MDQ6530996.1 hypothetical protein [Flavobacterium sp. LHD-85]